MADEPDSATYKSARKSFQEAAQSAKFFDTSYGYALYPSIGKGGGGVGAPRVQATCISKANTSRTRA